MNLIPRFYDAELGDIKIDNQSVYDTKIFSLVKIFHSLAKTQLF